MEKKLKEDHEEEEEREENIVHPVISHLNIFVNRKTNKFGIKLGKVDNVTYISQINSTMAGFKCGLRANDQLIKINKVSVENMNFEEIVSCLSSGETDVNLEIGRHELSIPWSVQTNEEFKTIHICRFNRRKKLCVNLSQDEKSVFITKIDEDSVGYKSGLRLNDRIYKINQIFVGTCDYKIVIDRLGDAGVEFDILISRKMTRGIEIIKNNDENSKETKELEKSVETPLPPSPTPSTPPPFDNEMPFQSSFPTSFREHKASTASSTSLGDTNYHTMICSSNQNQDNVDATSPSSSSTALQNPIQGSSISADFQGQSSTLINENSVEKENEKTNEQTAEVLIQISQLLKLAVEEDEDGEKNNELNAMLDSMSRIEEPIVHFIKLINKFRLMKSELNNTKFDLNKKEEELKENACLLTVENHYQNSLEPNSISKIVIDELNIKVKNLAAEVEHLNSIRRVPTLNERHTQTDSRPDSCSDDLNGFSLLNFSPNQITSPENVQNQFFTRKSSSEKETSTSETTTTTTDEIPSSHCLDEKLSEKDKEIDQLKEKLSKMKTKVNDYKKQRDFDEKEVKTRTKRATDIENEKNKIMNNYLDEIIKNRQKIQQLQRELNEKVQKKEEDQDIENCENYCPPNQQMERNDKSTGREKANVESPCKTDDELHSNVEKANDFSFLYLPRQHDDKNEKQEDDESHSSFHSADQETNPMDDVELNLKDKEIDQLKGELNEIKRKHAEEMRDVEQRMNSVREELSKFTEAATKQNKAIEDYLNELEKNREDIAKLRNDLDQEKLRSNNQVKESQEQVKLFEEEINRLKEEKRNFIIELGKIVRKKADPSLDDEALKNWLNKELKDMVLDRANIKEKLRVALEVDLKKSQEEKDKLQKELKTLEEENKKLSKQTKDLTKLHKDGQKRVKSLQEEIDKLKKTFSQKEIEWKSREDELHKKEATNEKTINNLETEIDLLNEEIERLNRLQEEVDSLKQEVDELQGSLEKTKKSLENIRQEKNLAKQESAGLKHRNKQMQQKLEEYEAKYSNEIQPATSSSET